MNLYIYKFYQFILNKLTLPGLTFILLIIVGSVYYVGLLTYLGIHTLVALAFNPPVPLLTIFFVGIVLVEGVYSHTYMPFIICRRRLDVPNAPWESFETFILDFDEEESSEFFDFQNELFSNDGFCPRSFAEMDTPHEANLGERLTSINQIGEFFNYVLPRMAHQFDKTYMQSLTFPTIRDRTGIRSVYGKKDYLWFRIKLWYGTSLIERAPINPSEFLYDMHDNFQGPDYLKSVYNIDSHNEFEELGISLISGSAEDSSSYIYEIEQPQFFPTEAICRLTDAYDPDGLRLSIYKRRSDYFGIKNMGTFLENMTNPETYSYNNNYELLDEYPVNLSEFYMKRDWEENPDALTFRDPFTGNYSNLTRFTASSFKLDLNTFRQEFLLMHKLPRTTKSQNVMLAKNINVEFINRNNNKLIQQHINISRFIVPEFMRFGWISYLHNLIERGLRYYVAMDKDRSLRMYSGFPAELELLPTGSVFGYMNVLFKPKRALFKKLYINLILIIRTRLWDHNMFVNYVINKILFYLSLSYKMTKRVIQLPIKYSSFVIVKIIGFCLKYFNLPKIELNKSKWSKPFRFINLWTVSKSINNNNVQTKNSVSLLILM